LGGVCREIRKRASITGNLSLLVATVSIGRLRLYTRRNYYSVLPRVVYFPKIKEALVWVAQCKEG